MTELQKLNWEQQHKITLNRVNNRCGCIILYQIFSNATAEQ